MYYTVLPIVQVQSVPEKMSTICYCVLIGWVIAYSARIVVVDAQTFLIPSFSYDGAAPDAHFWAGRGDKPGPEGEWGGGGRWRWTANNPTGLLKLTSVANL